MKIVAGCRRGTPDAGSSFRRCSFVVYHPQVSLLSSPTPGVLRLVNRPAVILAALLVASAAGAQARTGMMTVGDAALRYEVTGSGPALVFINGAALNYSTWDEKVRPEAFNRELRAFLARVPRQR